VTVESSTVARNPAPPERRPAFLLLVLVPLIPVLAMIFLVRWNYQKSPLDVSLFWNDEVVNWHQVKSFSRAGFNAGYYTLNEHPAPASFTPFYVHGPWYPMFAWTIARVTGWAIHSGVVLNCVLVSLALYAFVLILPLGNGGLALLAGVLAVAYPIIFYLPISMQEAPQQAMAIILALGFSYLFAHQERSSLPAKTILVGVVLIASITRMSWAILLPPLFLLINRKNRRGLLIAIVQIGISAALVGWIAFETTPPGNHSVFGATAGFTRSPSDALGPFLLGLAANGRLYYSFAGQNALDVNQKIAVTTLVLLLFIQMSGSFLNHVRSGRPYVPDDQVTLFHLYNLIGIHCASFAFYIIGTWGDYRVIYSHILLTLLLLILSGRRLTVLCFIAVSLLSMPEVHTYFRSFTAQKYAESTRTPDALYGQVASVLHYDARATSRWCNTVLMDIGLYDGVVTTIPGGFGTSVISNVNSMPAIRSRYLWITDVTYESLSRQIPELRLRPLLAMPRGELYFNPNADCHAPGPPASRDAPSRP